MECRIFLLAMAACPLLAEQQTDIRETLLAPAHSCTFCQKDRAGRAMLRASFLIWQSKEWGLEFAAKSMTASDPASSLQTFKQKLFVPDFSWSPGCKVDFGYHLPHDGWDVYSRWTYYHGDFTNLKKHLGSQIGPTGYGIVPLWHYPFISISSASISAPLRFMNGASNWKLFFNSIDLDLGRSFTPLSTLIFRMHVGAKAAWLRQHYHVEYTDGTTIDGILRVAPAQSLHYLSSRMVHNSHSWGIGPKGGLESKWRFGWGFSLSADGGLSLLNSFFNLHTRFSDQLYNLTALENLSDNLHMKKHQWELTPVFEGTIGVNWGSCFGRKENPYYLGLSVAYEVQYWWSQNHAQRNFAYAAPGNMWDMRGDLQMHGLTASLKTDF
jgi:hypothetical protein